MIKSEQAKIVLPFLVACDKKRMYIQKLGLSYAYLHPAYLTSSLDDFTSLLKELKTCLRDDAHRVRHALPTPLGTTHLVEKYESKFKKTTKAVLAFADKLNQTKKIESTRLARLYKTLDDYLFDLNTACTDSEEMILSYKAKVSTGGIK